MLVFVNSKAGESSRISQAARSGFNNDLAGTYIPKISFTNPDSSRHLFSVKYKDWEEESKTVRNIKKKISESDLSTTTQESDTDKDQTTNPDTPNEAVKEWTNSSGKTILAAFVKIEGDKVVLKLKNGKIVRYPLSKLDSKSRKQAEGKDS